MRRLFYIFLLWLLPAGLSAQTARFVNYGPDDGLTSSSVYTVVIAWLLAFAACRIGLAL